MNAKFSESVLMPLYTELQICSLHSYMQHLSINIGTTQLVALQGSEHNPTFHNLITTIHHQDLIPEQDVNGSSPQIYSLKT